MHPHKMPENQPETKKCIQSVESPIEALINVQNLWTLYVMHATHEYIDVNEILAMLLERRKV